MPILLLLAGLLLNVAPVFSSDERAADAAGFSLPVHDTLQFNTRYRQGVALRDAGEYRGASESFYLAFRAAPKDTLAPNALYFAAQCAEQDSAFERAVELYGVFSRRFAPDRRAPEAVFSHVRLLAGQREYQRAADVLTALEKLTAGNPLHRARALYYRSLLDRNVSRKTEAKSSLAALIAMQNIRIPEMEQACLEYIDLLDGTGEYSTTLAVFERLAGVYTRKSLIMPRRMLFHWANNARMAQSYSLAEDTYTALLKTYPDSSKQELVWFRVAECQAGRGNTARAIETLQQLCTLDSAGEVGAQAALKLGDLYAAGNMYTGAVSMYRRYLAMPGSRNRDAVLFRIGTMLQEKAANPGAALVAYDALISEYPASALGARALFAGAVCCETMNDYTDALRRYRRLLWVYRNDDLAVLSRRRMECLEANILADPAGATIRLTELLQRQAAGEILQYSDQRALADILLDQLRNPADAMVVFDRLLLPASGASDSVRYRALLGRAGCFALLGARARCANDSAGGAKNTATAKDLYRTVCAGSFPALVREESSFALLQLDSGGIPRCEAFLAAFPDGKYRSKVEECLARAYEQTAVASDLHTALRLYTAVARRLMADTAAAGALAGTVRCAVMLQLPDSAIQGALVFNTKYRESSFRPDVLYHLSLAYEQKHDPQRALEVYRELVRLFPRHDVADAGRMRIADLLFGQKLFLEAADAYTRYLESCGPQGRIREARLNLARCLSAAGNTRGAQEILFAQVDTVQDSLGVLVTVETGRLALRDGDSTGALESFRSACVSGAPLLMTAPFLQTGDLLLGMRAYGKAREVFFKALLFACTVDDSADAMRGWAVALVMDGSPQEAGTMIARIRTRFPGRTSILAELAYMQGMRLLINRDVGGAAKQFERCMAAYPATPWFEKAAYRLAMCPSAQGNSAKSINLLMDFVKRFPTSVMLPYAQSDLASLYHNNGENLRAAELYAAAAGNPTADQKNRFHAAYNAALSYQRISAWGDAALMYQLIAREFPNEVLPSSLYLKIGFCLVQSAHYDVALDWFYKASRDPAPEEKPELLYWIGTCHAKNGDVKKAITEYLKVPYFYIGVGRWAVTAQFEAARLYENSGNSTAALRLYREILITEGRASDLGKGAALKVDALSASMR